MSKADEWSPYVVCPTAWMEAQDRIADLERQLGETKYTQELATRALSDLTLGLTAAFRDAPHPFDEGTSISSAGYRQGFRQAWTHAEAVVKAHIKKDDGSQYVEEIERERDALKATLEQTRKLIWEAEHDLRCYVLPNTGCDEAHGSHRLIVMALAALDAEKANATKTSTDTKA